MSQQQHPRAIECRLNDQRSRQRGVTVLESACALTISAILLGASIPGFDAWRQTRQMAATLAELQTDVQLARSEAVLRRSPIILSVMQISGGSCYVVHSGDVGACECDDAGQSRCVAGAVAIRTVAIPGTAHLRWSSNSPQLHFDPTHGTVTPTATLRLVGDAGRELRAVINVRGRVRTCSASGSFAGYKSC
jgi:type IV fimbrial biogenesis protein FimT